VVTANGWFAARPSGTEDIYKIYAESFQGQDHLRRIQNEARQIVDAVFQSAGRHCDDGVVERSPSFNNNVDAVHAVLPLS
jgi:hypothetical protein